MRRTGFIQNQVPLLITPVPPANASPGLQLLIGWDRLPEILDSHSGFIMVGRIATEMVRHILDIEKWLNGPLEMIDQGGRDRMNLDPTKVVSGIQLIFERKERYVDSKRA